MVISCKPSEYRVNDRIYNFLSIFLLNSAIAIFILFFFFKYIHKVVFLPKKINFKVQTFCEISTFRFWLPVFFIMPPSKRTKCSLGKSNPAPPPPPPLRKESCAFGLVWSIYLLDGISPLKKKTWLRAWRRQK